MKDLIAKLEAATEGSRELDAEIWWNTGRRYAESCWRNAAMGNPSVVTKSMRYRGLGSIAVKAYAPHFTTSLDAALTLVPDGWCGDVDICPIESTPGCGLLHLATGRVVYSRAQTSPLALCVAALKAKAA